MTLNRVYLNNIHALQQAYPQLAGRVKGLPSPDVVVPFTAKDGGIAYGVRQPSGLVPITNAVNPQAILQKQVEQQMNYISDYTRPILVVGLNPGNELLALYQRSEKDKAPHCPQPIWVIIDSALTLCGMMQVWDLSDIFASPRVRFFWYEEIDQQIEWLRTHPEFPHYFTLISGAADHTLNAVMPPIAALIEERDQQTAHMMEENEAYYQAQSDDELAAVVKGAGGRPPRMMMPTCSWSTFIQHSTRDTCAAFEQQGWETKPLKMDAMLTPYYLVSHIHRFKPDVFLFIDHMRYEAEEWYPRDMLFITWVQDEMNNMYCKKAGESIARYAKDRRRDLIVGYVDDRFTHLYAYPKERLVPLKIMADPKIFHPVEISVSDRRRYGCALAFMTNVSMSTEELMETVIVPGMFDYDVDKSELYSVHDQLWQRYRAGDVLANRTELLEFLKSFGSLQVLLNQDDLELTEKILRLFYWRLNDSVYRHVVIEWAMQLGVDLHLYGLGWERHPVFKKFAQGSVRHGAELNLAYQAAGANLHLNIMQGMHQRLWEIDAAGGRIIGRRRHELPGTGCPSAVSMQQIAGHLLSGGTIRTADWQNEPSVNDWLFRLALREAGQISPTSSVSEDVLEQRVAERAEHLIMSRPEWVFPHWDRCIFDTKDELAVLLK